MKNTIVGLILSVMLLFSAIPNIAQDPEGNNVEDNFVTPDSLYTSDVLVFGDEYNKKNNTTIIVILAAAAVVAGGVFIVFRRRKKAT